MYVHRYGGRQSQTPRPGPISRRLDRSGPGVGRSGPRSTRSGRPPRQARSSAHARNVIGEAPHPAPVHAARARPRGETPITQCMQKIKATTSTSTARSIWAAHEGKAGPCVHVPVCVSSACLYTHAPCTCPSLLGCRRLCPPAMPTGNHPTRRAHERVHVHVHALVGHHRHRAYVPPDGLLPPPPSRDRPGVGVPCAGPCPPGPGRSKRTYNARVSGPDRSPPPQRQRDRARTHARSRAQPTIACNTTSISRVPKSATDADGAFARLRPVGRARARAVSCLGISVASARLLAFFRGPSGCRCSDRCLPRHAVLCFLRRRRDHSSQHGKRNETICGFGVHQLRAAWAGSWCWARPPHRRSTLNP